MGLGDGDGDGGLSEIGDGGGNEGVRSTANPHQPA
jgi:hypothetical protein